MPFYLAVVAVAALAGGIASISGMGIGSLITPLLAYKYGMKTAVAAVSIPHLVATALRFYTLRQNVDWSVFLRFGLLNALGSLLGALLHTRVDSPVLTAILGSLLVFAGLAGLTGYSERMRFGPTAARIAGIASGGFGGLVGNQGGIRSAAMLGLGLQGTTFVATATAIALAVDGARMPFYFATEPRAIVGAAPSIAAAVLGGVIGTLAGARLLRRIPAPVFNRVVSALLLLIGTFVLASAGRLPE